MIWLIMLLFCAVPSFAQSDEDSVIIQENGPDVPVIDTAVTINENETGIFLNKWEYDSLSVEQRHLSDSIRKKMLEDKDFWYANAAFEKEKKKQAEKNNSSGYVPLGQRTWFQTIIWLIIIGGFAAFLMIYLSSSNIGLFRKKNIITQTAGGDEEITEDIFAINYQKEIDKASSQGNFRLAIRLMYLRLLKNLSEKNIIQYKQDKTNLDYLMQLHATKYYSNFFKVTRDYEYSWYGKFDVSETAYKFIRNEFDQFDSELR